MLPSDANREQAQALLDAAERDAVTLRILKEAAGAPRETTLFHAQQAIEKGLKAALVGAGIVFRRTHDLLELADLAQANALRVPVGRELLTRLAPYAVEFRYLGVAAPEVSVEEAAAAVAATMTWARSQGEMQ
jgi:HEPN domain-containing protein